MADNCYCWDTVEVESRTRVLLKIAVVAQRKDWREHYGRHCSAADSSEEEEVDTNIAAAVRRIDWRGHYGRHCSAADLSEVD